MRNIMYIKNLKEGLACKILHLPILFNFLIITMKNYYQNNMSFLFNTICSIPFVKNSITKHWICRILKIIQHLYD